MQSIIKTTLAGVLKAERVVVALGFFTMTLLLLIDTLGREFFSIGLFGVNIFATYVLICAAMAGFGVATACGEHLRPKVADGLFKGKAAATSIRIGQLVTAAIALALTIAAIEFVVDTYNYGETNQVVGWPLWPVQMALPIGFGIAALRHFAYALYPSLQPQEKGTHP